MIKMICLAGFGENSSMFTPLAQTRLSSLIEVIPFDMPGFGLPAFSDEPTTLDTLAKAVDEKARSCGASHILAHSVASIIASLAVKRDGTPLTTIFSLEGNLTADDAYFSGTAANYDSPKAFRAAFLNQLSELSKEQPVIARYRSSVETADPQALWELGRDAQRFSEEYVPGEILTQSANAVYLYNPQNIPSASRDWLKAHDIPRLEMKNATHWKSVDQPELLAGKLIQALTISGAIN